MNKIAVLVVDDSAFMRRLIAELINEDSRMHVIGTARDGQDALKKVKELKPDVITLDVNLPDMTGLDVLNQLMASKPIPTIMLSSLTDRGASITVEAMALGAVGFIPKPSGEISLDLYKIKSELIEKIVEASQSHVYDMIDHSKETRKLPNIVKNNKVKLVCIGASTGGPRALRSVITKLPASLPVPVVVVQHMPETFTKSFAQKLNQWSSITVKEASHGEVLRNGMVYIAPGGHQTRVKSVGQTLAFHVDRSPIVRGLRPSFDVLLASVTESQIDDVLTVTLTGMGTDGARGLTELKQVSHVHAIAESEKTAVIFGMPKAAIKTGLIDETLDLNNISAAIINHIG